MRKSYLLLVALLGCLWVVGPTYAQETKTAAPVPTATVPATTTPAAAPAPTSIPTTATAADDSKPESAAAPTTEEPKQEWWEYGLAELMKLVFLILGLMATALVTVLMKKYGFEAQTAKINDLLTKAVGFAEQKALAASKLEEGKKTPGAEKMAMAVEFAQAMAKEYKLPAKAADWWEKKLEAWLGVTGASNTNSG